MDPGGPFLSAALFCERVLTEQDGVLSAIRMVDRVIFVLGDDGQPINPQHPIAFLIMLKSGAARGTVNLEIRREDPSGQESPVLGTAVLMEGEERGANIVIDTLFVPGEPGLFWFDVYLDGTRLTRMPLRAIFQPQPTTG